VIVIAGDHDRYDHDRREIVFREDGDDDDDVMSRGLRVRTNARWSS
jgi:hypothetical protein